MAMDEADLPGGSVSFLNGEQLCFVVIYSAHFEQGNSDSTVGMLVELSHGLPVGWSW